MRYLFLFTGLVIANSLAYCQVTKIRGKVTDSSTYEPMPFVSVALKNSTIGTITDFNGEYYIETKDTTDTITASFIGYRTLNTPIKKNIFQEINFAMIPENIKIQEVVVKPGENPAHVLLRKIIKNRANHNPENYKEYKYLVYNKVEVDINNIDEKFRNRKIFKQIDFAFKNIDTSVITGKPYLPFIMTESLSDYYYKNTNPILEKEVIKASRISGTQNESVSHFTGALYQKQNIYNNYFTFFQPGFVSPISSTGLLFYKYYLIDSAYIDNYWCYQVSFKPRRKQELTFSGNFWVNDTTFAIKKIRMRLSSTANINYINDLAIENEYDLVNDSLWFLKQEKILVDFNLRDKATGFFGRKTTVYSDFKLKDPIPDHIYGMKENTALEINAIKNSDDYWNKVRPVDLTMREANVYKMIDSIKQTPIYRHTEGVMNMLLNYYYIVGKFEIGPYYKTLSYNEIEGYRLRLGGRTSNDFSTKVMLDGRVAYGFRDGRIKYGAGVLYMFNKNPRISAGFNYLHDMQQLGQSPNALTEDNLLTSILRRNPNYKLTIVDEYKGFYEKEWFQGLSNTLTYTHKTIYATDYIQFKIKHGPNSMSLPKLTTSEINLNTKFAYNEKFLLGEFERISLGSDYPVINFNATFGVKDFLGGDYSYTKLHLNVKDKININPLGYLRYIIDAGKIYGKLPYPVLKLHEGNETYALDQYAFNMMNYYEFVSDTYASINLEHHFNGFFLNKVPLFSKLKLREVASFKALFGTLSSQNKNIMEFPDGLNYLTEPYYETSIGVENILKLFRLDYLWRLSYTDNPDIKKYGLRLKLQIIL